MEQSKNLNYNLPSGFDIELTPSEKRLESYLLDIIRTVFERYGFTPIETPAVERLEILQAKGNQGDNIIYGINPIIESSEEDKTKKNSENRALKFDQTVPLAAYIARHLNDLVFPFARYQMDMVFRGERAKKGRYRQFRQCDIDVVGRQKLSIFYDAQMPAIIAEIFSTINIGKFAIRINNKKILTGIFKSLGIKEEKIKSYIQIIDTLDKVGAKKVRENLQAQGLSESQSLQIIDFIGLKGTVDEVMNALKQKCTEIDNSDTFCEGVNELQDVIDGIKFLKVPNDRYCIDLSIARGLNYYTGTVYETTLVDHESIGSICSGGRYENLVGVFVGEKMPGVGVSIGWTRLLRKLLDNNILQPLPASPAQIMILNLQKELIGTYLEVSRELRDAGFNVLTEFEEKKFSKQLQRADRLGIPICLIIGSEEYKTGSCKIKLLKTGTQVEVPLQNLVIELRKKLLEVE
jgi:histidyl-tRNA synthetase